MEDFIAVSTIISILAVFLTGLKLYFIEHQRYKYKKKSFSIESIERIGNITAFVVSLLLCAIILFSLYTNIHNDPLDKENASVTADAIIVCNEIKSVVNNTEDDSQEAIEKSTKSYLESRGYDNVYTHVVFESTNSPNKFKRSITISYTNNGHDVKKELIDTIPLSP